MQIVLNITQKTFFLALIGIITILLAISGTAAVFHKSEQVQPGVFGSDAGFGGPSAVYVFTGSVGIGNITNPGSASLNVSKNIAFNTTGAGIVFADGTFMATAATGGGDGVVNSTAWNRTLTNVILHNIGDFVGIGTPTPAEKLHVEGNATIKGNLTVGSSTVFIDGSSNRVGIGTTSPSENLHITGNSTLKGNLTIWNENSVGAGMVFIDSSSNNTVGIGTQTPQEMLHVQGNATIKGNLTVGSGTVFVDGTSNKVGIGTTSPSKNLDVQGTAQFTGNVDANSGVDVTGDLTVGGTAFVVGSTGRVGIGNAATTPAMFSVRGAAFFGQQGYDTGYSQSSLNENDFVIRGLNTRGLFFVDGDPGRIGIGFTDPTAQTPDATLEVFGGLCVSDDPSTDDCTTAVGTIRADGTITANAFDLAERIWSDEELEPGDVVIIDPKLKEKVKRSTKSYDATVAGIVSTKPGNVLGWEDKGNVLLSLAGRVPVKATAENGPIQNGDLLTSSSTPGQAMKFTLLKFTGKETPSELADKLNENERRRNAIVGKALEPLPSGTGTIVALVTLQ